MDKRSLVRVALLVFVAAGVAAIGLSGARDRAARRAVASSAEVAAGSTAANPTTAATTGHQVVAYYFHRTMRCNTCRSIESRAASTIARDFAVEMERGALAWQVVNVDEPRFEHFVDEYDLASSALVLVELQDGRAVRWTALEDVWGLVDDPARFEGYVASQLRAYLGGPS